MTPSRAQIILAFAAMYLVGGSVFLGQRVAMHGGLTAFLTSGVRMAFAGAILLAWTRTRGGGLAPRGTWLDLAISGSLLFVGGSALSMLATDRIASGLVALLTATVPFWITIGAALLPGGERPASLGALGLVLGFAGLAIVIVPTVHGDATASGIAISLISAVAWAAGSLWARYRLRALPAMTIASHQMLFGALPLIAIGLGRGELAQLAPTGDGLLALAYLIVFGNLIAYLAFVFLMNHVSPAKVSTYAYINPILAIALGSWLAGEHLPANGLVGAAAILAGVALANFSSRSRRKS